MLLNGQEYSWSQAVFSIGGVVVSGINAIEYSDSRAMTNNYGAGSKPVSRSYGKYEATGNITLHMSEVEKLQKVAPGGDLSLLNAFDVTVTFTPAPGQLPVVHKIRGCQFLGNKRTMGNEDEMFAVQLDLIVEEIIWF